MCQGDLCEFEGHPKDSTCNYGKLADDDDDDDALKKIANARFANHVHM